jgi:O-antigen/teichoic acid export membrane protein
MGTHGLSVAMVTDVSAADDRPPAPMKPWLRTSLAALRSSHGVHSGALLALATLVLNGSGYLFNVACIRFLGPSGYGDVAALIALATLLALPLGSVQFLLAREVAFLEAADASPVIRRLLRRVLAIATPATLVIVVIGLATMGPLADALKIERTATVAAGLAGIAIAVIVTILYGFLQGLQRFGLLGLSYVVSGLLRPILVVPVLFAGLGATGAVSVNAVAGLAAFAIAVVALRDLIGGEVSSRPPSIDKNQVLVMMGGTLAFASLTNADILLASYYLSDDEAGVYAAAAFVGKFVLFLPSAIVTVLLPKASFRAASGANPRRILFASAGVTFALTITASALLALTPESLLIRAFGPGFSTAASLLGWFGLAMTAAALVNVYLSVYFAERNVWFPLVVMVGAIGQIVGVVIWHDEPLAIVLVTLVCCAGIMAIHEFAFPHALRHELRRTDDLEPAPVAGRESSSPLT